MPAYRFAPNFVAGPSAEDADRWPEILARAYGARVRPVCLCAAGSGKQDAPAMYIALMHGRHVLKRMPLSGAAHAVHCEHYEAPSELSGRGQVVGAAVRENPDDGTTNLALDFALTKGAARAQPAAGATEHESVRSDGTKLTLRATLHYLFDEAGLSRWSPRMRGKRSWFVVRRELLAAAAAQRTKGRPLTELLFIPEPYSPEKAREIAAHRAHELARLAESPAARMLIIAPVKHMDQARFGHKLVLKHLPELHLQVNDDLCKRISERFLPQFTLWGQLEDTHLLLIGTISQPMPGIYSLEEASFVNVNAGWVPFESLHEQQLLEALAERRFAKGLRYNMPRSKPLASAVLQDTDEPVALYVVEASTGDEDRDALESLVASSELKAWRWDCRAGSMPPLPSERAKASAPQRPGHAVSAPAPDELRAAT